MFKRNKTMVKRDNTMVKPDSTMIKHDSTVMMHDRTMVKLGSTMVKLESTMIERESTMMELDNAIMKVDRTMVTDHPIVALQNRLYYSKLTLCPFKINVSFYDIATFYCIEVDDVAVYQSLASQSAESVTSISLHSLIGNLR